MTRDEFWKIIDDVHARSGGDMAQKEELLEDALLALPEAELVEFITHFGTVRVEAYRWDLWAAAYILNGGCSDDAFDDFRATLISLGRQTYEAALADPESLADVEFDGDDPCHEGYQYVPTSVSKASGISISRQVQYPDDPIGEPWDEDTVDDLYPKLVEAAERLGNR